MKFIPVELPILCILLLLLVLIIGYVICSRCKHTRDRTQIFLEFTDSQESAQVKLMDLRYAWRITVSRLLILTEIQWISNCNRGG